MARQAFTGRAFTAEGGNQGAVDDFYALGGKGKMEGMHVADGKYQVVKGADGYVPGGYDIVGRKKGFSLSEYLVKRRDPPPAPAAAAAPVAAPPPPPVAEKPKVAFSSESFGSSPFQASRPNAVRPKAFEADTQARDYEGFVKGLDKTRTAEASSSSSSSNQPSRGSGAGGRRFAASQKFRDGINRRLGTR